MTDPAEVLQYLGYSLDEINIQKKRYRDALEKYAVEHQHNCNLEDFWEEFDD